MKVYCHTVKLKLSRKLQFICSGLAAVDSFRAILREIQKRNLISNCQLLKSNQFIFKLQGRSEQSTYLLLVFSFPSNCWNLITDKQTSFFCDDV